MTSNPSCTTPSLPFLAERIEQVPISDLRSNQQQARKHSAAKLDRLARNIKAFGFALPVLIDENGYVIVGYARVTAANEIGMTCVPAVRISHLNDAEKKAYHIADNQLTLDAEWDLKALQALSLDISDAGLDIALTGFSQDDLDKLLGGLEIPPLDADDQPPVPSEDNVVSRPGDLWLLGKHRVLCADSTQGASYARLLGDDKARMVISDLPYNLRIQGTVSGLGKHQHAEFRMASGEMSEAEFTAFLGKVFALLVDHTTDGSLHYHFMDWRHLHEISMAGRANYTELKNLCVWNKNNAGMGSLYRSKHELIFVYKSGKAAHVNNIELGKHGRYRTNVFDYPGANAFGPDRDEHLAAHPTVKPVQLITDLLLDCSNSGDLILDPFLGSGTTILAAQQAGRVAAGLEIEPRYVDVAIGRYEALTGTKAIHSGTGLSFTEMRCQRQQAAKGEAA